MPGTAMAPPMTRRDLAFRKVVGAWAAAVAKVVRGPMAMRVMVWGGSRSRMLRISRWAGEEEGVKRGEVGEVEAGLVVVVVVAVEERTVSGGGRSKRCCHVSEGLV